MLSLGTVTRAASGADVVAPLDVVGWPGVPEWTATTAAPGLEVGSDPVLGRQACPPLTRLSLVEGKGEDILLRHAVEEYRDARDDGGKGDRHGAFWRFEVRTGLWWWNGDAVTPTHVADFVRAQMANVARDRSGGVWHLPEFEVKTDGDKYVTVQWRQAPPFGPFVFNDAPFFRSVAASGSGLRFECAGLYGAAVKDFGLELTPTPAYKVRKPLPVVRLYRVGSRPAGGQQRTLEFQMAEAFGGDPATRASDTGAACGRTFDLPYMTMIAWNVQRAPLTEVAFRQALTQLTPRGVLATSAAAALADTATAAIPKGHPGYDGKLSPRPFDFQAAAQALTKLGYKRPAADGPRLRPDGKPLQLELSTQPGSSGLMEKVIVDAYASVGIVVTFQTAGASNAPDLDGALGVFAMDWPRASLLADLHGGAEDATFWSPRDQALDQALEAYARSVTEPVPDFKLLGRVHQRLTQLEPMTVVLQHKACVQAGTGISVAHGALDPKDPDWFRQLLF